MVDRSEALAYVPRFIPIQGQAPTMFTFLLVVQAIIAAMLVTVILMQRSEGGGLTSGGSPSGLMSARGAADFLTRATAVLATLFILMCIALAVVAATRQSSRIDTSQVSAPAAPTLPKAAQGTASDDPLGDAATNFVGAQNASDVPVAQ